MPAGPHFLIVGGGLAGLALARGLAVNGMRSTVFEIRSAPNSAGSSISLAPNALRALDQCMQVYHLLQSRGYSYKRLEMRVQEGWLIGHVAQYDDQYDALRIMRSTLHQTLIEACEESKLVTIKYGMKLLRIEESADTVTAHFEDGSSATGDALIGADGIHSRVREHVLGDVKAAPVYGGTCLISGSMPRAAVKAPADATFPLIFITPIGMISAFPHTPNGDELACFVSEDLPEKDRDGWAEYKRSGSACRAAKSHYADVENETIRSLLDNMHEDEADLWAPYSLAKELPTWHKGRTLIIGDAAHAMPPNGQGAAAAFEDAAYLTRLLTSPSALDKSIERIFAAFESNRRPRIAAISQAGHNVRCLPTLIVQLLESAQLEGTKKGQPSKLLWVLKRNLMWAFFRVKGGELQDNRISAYDVMQQSVDI